MNEGVNSQFFQVFLELHLLLLDQSRLVDLVGSLHGELALEDIQHVVGSGVSGRILVHQLLHHFSIDQDVVHALLEVAHVVGHHLKVRVVHPRDLGHLLEGGHHLFVTVHALHVGPDELHLHRHSLQVHG